jgi:hypothetical protein
MELPGKDRRDRSIGCRFDKKPLDNGNLYPEINK